MSVGCVLQEIVTCCCCCCWGWVGVDIAKGRPRGQELANRPQIGLRPTLGRCREGIHGIWVHLAAPHTPAHVVLCSVRESCERGERMREMGCEREREVSRRHSRNMGSSRSTTHTYKVV